MPYILFEGSSPGTWRMKPILCTMKWFRQLEKHLGSKELAYCQALVAHAWNPSCTEGRDQEDHHLKPAQANSSRDPWPSVLISTSRVAVITGVSYCAWLSYIISSGGVGKNEHRANGPLASISVLLAWHWWLTPVILATQEAEIGRIMVWS
jgi:hypothetical protein